MLILLKKIMSKNECIQLPEGVDISSQKKDSYKDVFTVKLKVNKTYFLLSKCFFLIKLICVLDQRLCNGEFEV